ncbi:YybH family protein [Chloroflexota bacterium]
MGSSLQPRDVLQAEEAIRALEAAYDDAWNRGDVDALIAFFTDDALIVDPRGGITRGQDGIRRLLSTMVGPGDGDSTHKSEIVRVEFVTPEVALVDGRAHIKGLPEEQNAQGLVHRFTDVVAWREGRWKIAHIRACPPEPDTTR